MEPEVRGTSGCR